MKVSKENLNPSTNRSNAMTVRVECFHMFVHIDHARDIHATIEQVQKATSTHSNTRRTPFFESSALEISLWPGEVKILQASDVAMLIHSLPGNVTAISVNGVNMVGNVSIFLDAVACISETLTTFRLSLHFKTTISSTNVLSIGTALARAPNLQFCQLDLDSDIEAWDALLSIVERPNSKLLSIAIKGQNLLSPDSTRFLTACSTLKHIFALTVEHNNTLRAHDVTAIATLIAQSTSLKSLQLRSNEDEVSLAGIAEALKTNRTLRSLTIQHRYFQNRGSPIMEDCVAFQEMLRDRNFTLTKLDIHSIYPSADSAISVDAIEFYLELNSLCRERLMAPSEDGQAKIASTDDDWMEVISNQFNLSIVYYFLRRNPSLCLAEKIAPAVVPMEWDSNY